MAGAFSNTAFSIASFSNGSFDFGTGPAPGPAASGTATPGYIRRSLRGMRAQVRGEDEDQKRKRRLEMGIIQLAPPPSAPIQMKPKGPRGKAVWKKR